MAERALLGTPPVVNVAQAYEARRGRRLPILNRDKRLVGIVSLGDLALESGDEQLSGETLKEVSEPVGAH